MGAIETLKILVTAFEPYDRWATNSSWDALSEMLKRWGPPPGVTTRRYPVDLEKLRVRLSKDLEQGFDAVLLLGQSPSASDIHLESLAVNIAGVQYNSGRLYGPLEHGGPAAYQSRMPIDRLRDALDREGVNASISYHAGTYLCNAIFYLTEHWHRQRGRDCQVGFAHFPLTTEQVRAEGREFGGVSRLDLAKGIAIMIEELRRGQGSSGGSGGESSWGYWAMGESANGMDNPLA